MLKRTIVFLGLLSLITCTKEPVTKIEQPNQLKS